MSDPTALSFNKLPLEILHGIFHYLDVPDILRMRRVSRYMNEASHCRDVWSHAYRKADFVRPPGPFLSQSAHDLENALVPSFRVDRDLRDGEGREKQTVKVRQIRYTGVDLCVSLVFGRFLVVALSNEVRCYDLNLDAFDSNSGASIIHRSTGGTLRSFRCVSAFDVEGRPFACAVLSEAIRTGFSAEKIIQISIYLLNVSEQSEVTLDLLHQFEHDVFDIDTVNLGPRLIVVQGRVGPDINDDQYLVALDVHTRTQFILPSFTRATWEAAKMPKRTTIEDITWPACISTSTHLLLARSFYTHAARWSTFFQAFALPHPNTHRPFTSQPIPLSPSHQGIIPDINGEDIILLQDSVLDASTQDVLITIRVHAYRPTHPHSSISQCGILRLGGTAHSTSSSSHDELGTVTFRLFSSLVRLSGMPFLHPSFNGIGRVYYIMVDRLVAAFEYDVRGGGSGGGGEDDELEAKVRCYPTILRFPTQRALMDYDPYSGRICVRSTMAKYRMIEILDLAVQ